MSTPSFVRVEKTGDWIRVRDIFNRMTHGDLANRAQEIIKEELENAGEELKQMILDQSFSWAKLTSDYQKYKESHGLDPRILISKEEYVNSFQVTRVGEQTWVLHPVGETDSGLTMEELGSLLEYGSADMPSRPHWAWVKESTPDKVRNRVRQEIMVQLRGGL